MTRIIIDNKKKQYAKAHGFTIHATTKQDRSKARSDYGRNSDFYVRCCDGREYFAGNGSWQALRETSEIVAACANPSKTWWC